MATGNHRFDRKSSNLTIFAASLAVAVVVAVLTYQPAADAESITSGAQTAEPVRLSPRCQEADRAGVAELANLLQRNRPSDAPVLERAIHTLNVARRHCLYDWDGRGLADYQWLSRWLSEQG